MFLTRQRQCNARRNALNRSNLKKYNRIVETIEKRLTRNWWRFNHRRWSKERWDITGCGNRCIQISRLNFGNGMVAVVGRTGLLGNACTNVMQQIQMRMQIGLRRIAVVVVVVLVMMCQMATRCLMIARLLLLMVIILMIDHGLMIDCMIIIGRK